MGGIEAANVGSATKESLGASDSAYIHNRIIGGLPSSVIPPQRLSLFPDDRFFTTNAKRARTMKDALKKKIAESSDAFENALSSSAGARRLRGCQKRILDAIQRCEVRVSEEVLQEWEYPMKRYRAAVANPEAEISKAWLSLGDQHPAEISHFVKGMMYPPAKRGRPKGCGCFASDPTLMPDMDRLVGEGMPPKTAARRLLLKRGFTTGIDDKAGYLVKLYKNYLARGKK